MVRNVECLVEPSAPVQRDDRNDATEQRASDRLVSIIDLLLALVLVEGAVAYRHIFTSDSDVRWWPAVLALVLVYYTALRSFIDWHIAMEETRYHILDRRHRNRELTRVYLDVVIMAMYSFVLLRAHVLLDDPGADLLAVAIAYVVIYLLYLAWNALLARTDPEAGGAFSQPLVGAAAAWAGVLLLSYAGARELGAGGAMLNSGLLALELILVMRYRRANWRQQLVLKGPMLTPKRPA